LSANNTHKAKVQEHFDRWAVNYDKGHITSWLRAFQQRTIEAMSPRAHAYVLDVGCGSGWAVSQLGALLIQGRAYGIDLSPAMIARAKDNTKGMANVRFEVGDSENIPYDDALFDAVMCSSSFHHYPNPVKALREFKRVLKPNGRAYVLDTCRDGSCLIFMYDLGHKFFVGDHIRYYHTSEIKTFFRSASFSEIREEFRVQRLFLYKKLTTSVTLISAQKPE
jgi:ubiquinone/menaquinone biosynthesis C-methylase UbiE